MKNYQELLHELKDPLQIDATVNANLKTVWEYWNGPNHIENWNSPSEEWHTPHAENDIRTGGKFKNRMEAIDKSAGFDFEGIYDEVIPEKLIRYQIADGRKVVVTFETVDTGIHIREAFEAETENPRDMQQMGWQSILDNFKKYVESNPSH